MTDPYYLQRPNFLQRPDGLRLAYRHATGDGPAVLFLHGLMSHMDGDKACALHHHAIARGWEFLRFDLSGHGQSGGNFEHGTVSAWRDDTLLAMARLRAQRVILVGSSIGGWLALLVALRRLAQVAGLLLIAPAPDMTRRVRESLTEAARAALAADGVWHRPSRYGAPIPITRAMLDDGDALCLLDGPIALDCPVRILHGQHDPDVPWQGSLRLAERLRARDVRTVLLKQGNHRLCEPDELALLLATLDELRATVAQADSAARIAASPSR
ncbi:alpha/beta hydrolase [Lichenicoccus sp.]|uniref:alpha/beta hydrolase n=1 Tax=Lichenicoccus sp. TaxID=2781899 RepID=UPI003D0D62AD